MSVGNARKTDRDLFISYEALFTKLNSSINDLATLLVDLGRHTRDRHVEQDCRELVERILGPVDA